jgi:hypothetical protein
VACFVFWREICHLTFSDFCNTICHKQTHAPQQTTGKDWLFDRLVGE